MIVDRLRALHAEGFGFGEALALLDSLYLETERGFAKAFSSGYEDFYGAQLATVAHFGRTICIPADHSVAHARALILWALRPVITPEVDIILEIGAGSGALITSIAVENKGLPKWFFGTDVVNLEGIELLAEIAQVPVETKHFDVTKPNLSFLPPGKVMVIANGVLNLFSEPIVSAFLEACLGLDLKAVCILDVLGKDFGRLFPDTNPIPTICEITQYGSQKGLSQGMDSMAEKLRCVRKIPLLTGSRPLYSLSYFQLEP